MDKKNGMQSNGHDDIVMPTGLPVMCSTDCVDTQSFLGIVDLNPNIIKEARIKRRLDRLAMRRLVPSAD